MAMFKLVCGKELFIQFPTALFTTEVCASCSPDSSEKPMPVGHYFLWCLAERPKEAPESANKKSWQSKSLQRMAGIGPEKK
ncbi:hypothetical protein [Flavobacterium erciyesense]|uniref:hypothetical protein n=1 Tax=Flavobacterium erciyesense TaxID=2825842 RepID=UPI001B379162|nr:hypothetical protein [Flavobacterium erciyesense]